MKFPRSVHVTAHGEGWTVWREGSRHVGSYFPAYGEAVAAGTRLASLYGAELLLHARHIDHLVERRWPGI